MKKTIILILCVLLGLFLVATTNRTYYHKAYCDKCGLGRSLNQYDCLGFIYWRRVRSYETSYHLAYTQYVSPTCSHSPVFWGGNSTGTWFKPGGAYEGSANFVMLYMDFSGLSKLHPHQAAAILKAIKPADIPGQNKFLVEQIKALQQLRSPKTTEAQSWWQKNAHLFGMKMPR